MSNSDQTGINVGIMTQSGMKQGIKQFGQGGIDALMAELKELGI
jgi:hypothetical protein